MVDEYSEIINLARLVIKACKEAIQEKLKNINKDQEIDDMLLSDIENILTITAKLKKYIDILRESKQKEAEEKGDDFIYTQFDLLFRDANNEIKEIENGSYLKNDFVKQKVEDIKNKIKKDMDETKTEIFINDFKEFLKKIKKAIYGEEKNIENKVNLEISGEYNGEDIFDVKFKKLSDILNKLEKDIFNKNQLNQNIDILNSKDNEKIDLNDLSELNLKEMKGKKVRVLQNGLYQLDPKYYDTNNISDLLDLYIEQLKCYKLHFKNLIEDGRIKIIQNPILIHIIPRFDANGRKNYFILYPKEVIKEFSSDDTYVSEHENEFDYNLSHVKEGSFLDEILKKNSSIGYKYLEKKGLYEVEEAIKNCCNIQKIINDIEIHIMPLINNYTSDNLLNEKINEIKLLKNDISDKLEKILKPNIEYWEQKYLYDNNRDGYSEIRKMLCDYVKSYLFFLNNLWVNIKRYENSNIINLYSNCDENCVIAILKDYENFYNYKESNEIKGYFENEKLIHILKDKYVFNKFIQSYFYFKNYKGYNFINGYYTLDKLIDDLSEIIIIKDKVKEYLEKFREYKIIEAEKKKSDIIYKRFEYQFSQIIYWLYDKNDGLEVFINRLIKKFKIEQKVKNAIKKRLEEQNKVEDIKDDTNIKDFIFNSLNGLRKIKENKNTIKTKINKEKIINQYKKNIEKFNSKNLNINKSNQKEEDIKNINNLEENNNKSNQKEEDIKNINNLEENNNKSNQNEEDIKNINNLDENNNENNQKEEDIKNINNLDENNNESNQNEENIKNINNLDENNNKSNQNEEDIKNINNLNINNNENNQNEEDIKNVNNLDENNNENNQKEEDIKNINNLEENNNENNQNEEDIKGGENDSNDNYIYQYYEYFENKK